MGDAHPSRVHFEHSNPILRVENMEASLRFYVDLLGFKNASWGSDDFTCIRRDGACIYLCRQGQGRGGAWVWVGVEDAEKLHAEYKARGVKIHMPPTNHSWALEFQVEDPDGNVLRLGSEPKDDRPFEDHNLEVTNMLEELTLKDKLSLYEDGKHRRYSLLFAVNGGAFAVANLLANEGARSKVLGQLSLAELSWGMILFTVVMVADIYAFGLKFEPNAFGPIGKLVLISIGLIICAGWLLAGCAQ